MILDTDSIVRTLVRLIQKHFLQRTARSLIAWRTNNPTDNTAMMGSIFSSLIRIRLLMTDTYHFFEG